MTRRVLKLQTTVPSQCSVHAAVRKMLFVFKFSFLNKDLVLKTAQRALMAPNSSKCDNKRPARCLRYLMWSGPGWSKTHTTHRLHSSVTLQRVPRVLRSSGRTQLSWFTSTHYLKLSHGPVPSCIVQPRFYVGFSGNAADYDCLMQVKLESDPQCQAFIFWPF